MSECACWQAINCDPVAILRFRVPGESAAETSQTDVILVVFLARDEDPVPEAPPQAPSRAPLGAQAAGPLTPHEKRLLKLLMQGHRYKTAAAELGVTPHTVSFHLRRVYQKLDVHSKSEAVIKAMRENLI
ncbi:MAG: helix-turn-helix transcriptional regulator [Bryobacteraceae bacterium]